MGCLSRWAIMMVGVGVSGALHAQEVVDRYFFAKGGDVIPLMSNVSHQDDASSQLKVPVRVEGSKQDTIIEVVSDGRDDSASPRRVKVVSPAGFPDKTYYVYPRWLNAGVKEAADNPEEIRKRINALLGSPSPSCPTKPPAQPERKSGRSLASRGMDKAINVFYQDCRASSVVVQKPYPLLKPFVEVETTGPSRRRIRSVTSAAKYSAAHPVLGALSSQENTPTQKRCLDQLADPKEGRLPIYGWGAKGRMTKSNPPTIEITHNQGPVPVSGVGNDRPHSSLDCSALVSVALMGAGLNLAPGKQPWPEMGTYHIDQAIGRSDSCLEVPKFEAGKGLVDGDIINVGGVHVVMVDSVGNDPFGLDGVENRGKCEEAAHAVETWNFRIAHSASVQHVGIHKVEASIYFSNPDTKGGRFYTLMTDWVKKLCLNKFSKNAISGSMSNTTNTLKIARHRSLKDGCSFSPKPNFESESCVENCKAI